jgi:hypothetical protein
MAAGCQLESPRRTLLSMAAWIALFAVTILFTLALRHGRPKEPPLPPDYDGERQLAELHALTASARIHRCPDRPRPAVLCPD